jgi:hypothetical protein
MRTLIVLAIAAIVAGSAGCSPIRGVWARPSLVEQSRTTTIWIVASGAAPDLSWNVFEEDRVVYGRRYPTDVASRDSSIAALVGQPEWQHSLAAAVVGAAARRHRVHFKTLELPRAPQNLQVTFPGVPPPGTQAYAVGIESVGLLGSDPDDRPVFLTARVYALKARWAGGSYAPAPGDAGSPEGQRLDPLVGAYVVDPTPRTRTEWLVDDGSALRSSLGRLLEMGAESIVADLTEVVEGVAAGPRAYCGLEPTEELLGLEPGWDPEVVRWKRFDPTLETSSPTRVTYEVRVWRIDAHGLTPVVEREALTEPAVEVTLARGHEHLFSARARIDLGGERSWTTPWSVQAEPGEGCGNRIEQQRTLRKLVKGMPASAPDPAPPPRPAVERAPLAASTDAPFSVRVADGLPRVRLRPVELSEGEAAASGAAKGAAAGAAKSIGCLFLAPVCAVFLVPLGAVVGGVSESERVASSQTSPEEMAQLRWALATAARDPGVRQALVESLRGARTGGGDAAKGAAARPADALELKWTAVSLTGGMHPDPATTLEVELIATLRREGAEPLRRAVVAVGPGPLPLRYWLRDDRAALIGAVRAQVLRAARDLLGSFDVRLPPPLHTEDRTSEGRPSGPPGITNGAGVGVITTG